MAHEEWGDGGDEGDEGDVVLLRGNRVSTARKSSGVEIHQPGDGEEIIT
ncbi:MAG TPA: hypothetical protein V6D25_28485 [Leptolyngbyaceae cyanobacterium]